MISPLSPHPALRSQAPPVAVAPELERPEAASAVRDGLKLGAIFMASFGLTLGLMSAGRALPPAPVAAVAVTLDVGHATVYGPGVWESTEATRASWLNPGLFDGPDGAHRRELVAEQAVVAVNPARFLPGYQPALEETIRRATEGLTPGTVAYENVAVRALLADKSLERMVNDQLIGRLVHARLPDGSLHEVVVMDVFRPDHAAVDLGLLTGMTMHPRPAANFVADFHNEWLRRQLGVAFDFNRGTYVDGSGRVAPAPEISLEA